MILVYNMLTCNITSQGVGWGGTNPRAHYLGAQ